MNGYIGEWLYRVEQLKEFYSVEEEDQKVRLAALHWRRDLYNSTIVTNNGAPLSWKEFEYGLLSVYDRSTIRLFWGVV